MAVAAQLMVKVGADINEAVAGLAKVSKEVSSTAKSIGSSMQDIGSSMMKVGAKASLISAPIVAGFAVATNAASDLAEATNKTEVVFKKNAGAVKKWADTSATSFGLSKRAALENVSTFGNLFDSMKLAPDVTMNMSKGLVELAADLASLNNIPIEVALEKLRSGMVGEMEPMRTLGVNLGAAEVKAYALAKGLAKTTEELTPAVLAQARYGMILEQTTNSQGDFKNTSDQLANSQRILKAQIENASASIGTLLLPYVLQAVQALQKLVTWFTNLSDPVKKVILVVGGLVAVVGPLLLGLGALISAVGTAISVFGALSGVVAAAAGAIGVAAAPVIAVVAAIIAVVALLVVAWNRDWGGIQEKTRAVMDFIKEKIGVVIEFIKGIIESGLAMIRAWWQEHGDSVMTIVNTLWNAIKTIVETVMTLIRSTIQVELEAIRAFWAAHGETIMTVTRNTWNMIKEIIGGVLQIIGGLVDAFAALLKGDWEGLSKAMQDISNGMWQIIGAIFKTALANLTAIAKDIVASIIGAFDGLKQGVADKFSAMKQGAVDAFNGLKQAILNVLENLKQEVFNAGAGLARRLADGIMSNVQAVTDAASALAAKVKEFLPGSDAKRGPLSHLFADGVGLVQRLAQGILSSNAAMIAAGKLSAGIAGSLSVGGYSIGGSASFNMGAGPGEQLATATLSASTPKGGNSYTINIYNPVGNPAEVDLVRTLRNMAMVGVI